MTVYNRLDEILATVDDITIMTSEQSWLFNVPYLLWQATSILKIHVSAFIQYSTTEISFFIWTSLRLNSTFRGQHSIHYVNLTVEYKLSD